MADLDNLARSYEALARAAHNERDPKVRAELEAMRDRALEALRSTSGGSTPEQGDVMLTPETLAKPPLSREGQRSLLALGVDPSTPSAPSANAPGGVASAQGVPAPATVTRPGFVDESQRRFGGPPEAVPAQASFQAPAVESAAPSGPTPFPSMSDADMRALQGRGGGGRGGGASLRGAMVNAGAARAATAEAESAQARALRAVGEQDQWAGSEEGRAVADALSELRAADANFQERLVAHQENARRIMAESQRATEEFRNVASERSLLTSLGETGNKLGVALSVALGAIGGGLSKSGGNVAMDVLRLRIDGDLRDRADRLRAKGAVMDQLDRLLARNLDLMGSEEAARNATKAALLDGLKLEVQRIGALNGGERSALSTEAVLAGLEVERRQAEEAKANQLLLQAQRAAARGAKSELDLYKERLAVRKQELEIRKLAAEMPGGAPKADPQLKKFIADKMSSSGVPEWEGLYGTWKKEGGKVPGVLVRGAVAYGQGDPIEVGIPVVGQVVGALDNAQRAAVNYGTSKFAPDEVRSAQQVNAMVQMGVRLLNRGTETEGDRAAIRDAIFMMRPSSPPEQVGKGIEIINNILIKKKAGIYGVDRASADEYEAERMRLEAAGGAAPAASGPPSWSRGQVGR